MTEAMRMRMNWVRIDVDDRMIFKTDLLLWDEEKEDNKDGTEMMITGNTCFCSDLIKSQQNVSYLQALPVIWVDSNKMFVLAIKTGRLWKILNRRWTKCTRDKVEGRVSCCAKKKNHRKLCYIYIPNYRKYLDSLEPIGALLSARITENLTVLWLVTIFINTCTVRICDPFYMVHVLVSLYRGKISLNLVQFFFFFIRENSIIF